MKIVLFFDFGMKLSLVLNIGWLMAHLLQEFLIVASKFSVKEKMYKN